MVGPHAKFQRDQIFHHIYECIESVATPSNYMLCAMLPRCGIDTTGTHHEYDRDMDFTYKR